MLILSEQRGRISSPNLLVSALLSIAQDAVGLLCCRGAPLARGQLAVHQDPQVFLCKVAFQLVDLQPTLLPSVIPLPVHF